MRFSACLMFAFVLLGSRPVLAQQADSSQQKSNRQKKSAPFRWVNPLPRDHDPRLQHVVFRSPSLQEDVGYAILLPPDYEQSGARRYPVVYYLHGGRPGSEAKAVRLAPLIRKEMEAAEPALEAIYVFVNGGPVSHYDLPDKPKAQGASVFINELIPHIDATYRTIADRSGRGLEGFSQGGRGTMRLSLRFPRLFCSVAAGGGGYATEKKISESGGWESPKLRFSEGDNVWDLAQAYADDKEAPPFRLMIYVGTNGFNYENNLQYMDYLRTLSIPFERLIVPDVPHSAQQIYQQRLRDIMQFHADSFAPAKPAR